MIRVSAFFFLFVFAFQVMDIPPAKNAHNSKTCCGRMICLCKHGKGKACDFHKIKKETASRPETNHGSCHLKAKSKPTHPNALVSKENKDTVSFSKAPCGSSSPKSIVRGYSKDYIFPFNTPHLNLSLQHFSLNPESFNLPAIRENGIDHPPQGLILPL